MGVQRQLWLAGMLRAAGKDLQGNVRCCKFDMYLHLEIDCGKGGLGGGGYIFMESQNVKGGSFFFLLIPPV